MWSDLSRFARRAGVAAAAGLVLLAGATAISLQAPPSRLPDTGADATRVRYLDREGQPLNVTYINDWNLHERLPLHRVPQTLQDAVVLAEDHRFYSHHGMDWLARFHAVWQDLRAFAPVRGASTISEQVVRMLHPRRRTPWARWLEGWEALWLESRFTKPDILEFYLNQVPYADQRRGVVQASRHYFGRDPDTLNEHEMLALAVLIRSPDGMAPWRGGHRLDSDIGRLASRMRHAGLLGPGSKELAAQPLSVPLQAAGEAPDVSTFVRALDDWPGAPGGAEIRTTLDAGIQRRVQEALVAQLRNDAAMGVHHAAALVVDHVTDEIVAWAVVTADGMPPTQMDAVRTRRQPGSTLKPLVYAAAFERGWSPATMILDAPLEQLVGTGMHEFNNYSRVHYGWISVREALGNSLNVPAVKAGQFVGTENLLHDLRAAGIDSLRGHPNFYGDGLALGNGEVTLYELVSAYATLARGGTWRPLTPFADDGKRESRTVFRPETATLIADILSDDSARQKEFGSHGVLDFPVQTAVKTGTSSDYRDAWTVGFDDRYVVGAWFGNLDYAPMHEITGSQGPAPAVRAIFDELDRWHDTRPLVRRGNLRMVRVCIDNGKPADAGCDARDEWFAPWMQPGTAADNDDRVRIRKPGPGLRLAMDPRIPARDQGFEFLVQAPGAISRVDWTVDGQAVGASRGERFVWPLQRGEHRVLARVWLASGTAPVTTGEVPFSVQ